MDLGDYKKGVSRIAEGSRGDSSPLLSKHLEAAWAHFISKASNHVTLISSSITTSPSLSLTLLPLSLTYKHFCDYLGVGKDS